ncbi:hypothetical protein ACFLX7_02520 [Chloroflexota bacterium]
MKTTAEKPLYLLDEHLSYKFAPVFQSLGYNMTSVEDVWHGRKNVEDPEIIPWLGENGEHHAVWITEDWEATKLHAKLIVSNKISVWWIREEKHIGLTGLQELQLISLIIQFVTDIILVSKSPTYLKASLIGRRPKLERMTCHLLSPKLTWGKVKLEY